VNLALLVVVPLLVATGLLAWVTPGASADALLVVHRVAGVGVVLALAWKYGIARRSVRRRSRGGSRLSLIVRRPSGAVISRKISPRLLATRMAVTIGDTWVLLPVFRAP